MLDPGDVINVTHPGFPGDYRKDANCYIKITASNNGSIRLSLVDFHTEANYDYLFIYRGSSSNSIATLTGEKYPNYTESPDIILHFQSDSSVAGRGFFFQAEWITEVSKYYVQRGWGRSDSNYRLGVGCLLRQAAGNFFILCPICEF